MRILIVDDLEDNLKVLRAGLEAEGITVYEAGDGVAALEVLERVSVDGIVSDILMPRMDGYRLCHEVRANERFCNLPFIVYTGTYTSAEDEKAAMDLGADRFFHKPSPIEIITTALREVIAAPLTRSAKPITPERELSSMKEYNSRLVAKLEERSVELESKNKALRLVEEQNKLQATAVATAADGIMITDRAGIIQWVNPAFSVLTGHAAEEVLGRNPRILKSGQHTADFYRQLWTTILAGNTWRGLFVNRRKDSRIYYDEHTITPVKAGGREITHFIAIMHDVTARKLAEDALRETHAQLRQLLEHSPAVIYALKIDGDRMIPDIVSENVTRLLGFEVEEAKSYDWWVSHLHPEDFERAVASLQETLTHGSSHTEYRMRHKDGSYRTVEDNRRLIRDAADLPAKLVGVWADITARKNAEAERVSLTQQIELLLASTGEGICGVDMNGNCTFVNRAGAEKLGYQVDELLGQSMHSLIHHHHSDGSPYLQNDCPICHTSLEGQACRVNTEVFWRRDGTAFPVEYSAFPILQDGKISGSVVTFSDITERQQSEQLRSTLTLSLSHELNTPLNGILGLMDLISSDLETMQPAAFREMLGLLQNSAERLNQTVQRNLDFAQLQMFLTGAQDPGAEHSTTAVKPLLQEIAESIGRRNQRWADVELHVSPGVALVDAHWLTRLLTELLDNAFKFSSSGTPIRITGGPYKQAFNFSVRDAGRGMTSEQIGAVGPFVQFDRLVYEQQGIGLGLYLARCIAELHHGGLTITSSPGQGTTVSLTLPGLTSETSGLA